MASRTSRSELLQTSSIARGLSLAGLVLSALYLSILAGSFFPIQLLDAAWQLKAGLALINVSPFSLLGLALLHLAHIVDPDDPLIADRQRLGSRLAVAAALGFLLLLPLLSVAAVSRLQQSTTTETRLISRANRHLHALRQVVASATTPAELRNRLIALNGPMLDGQDLSLPLPTTKAQVNRMLDEAASQVARQQQSLPPRNPWSLLPELLRNGFACIALFLGFAGLAQRPNMELSFLGELQGAWFRLQLRRSHAHRADRIGSHEDYLRQISDDQD